MSTLSPVLSPPDVCDEGDQKHAKPQHNKSKPRFRTYPCQNVVTNGGCPYFSRCSYVHDPRIKLKYQIVRMGKRQCHDGTDSFFWPDQILEGAKVIPADQPYEVPAWCGEAASSNEFGRVTFLPTCSTEHDMLYGSNAMRMTNIERYFTPTIFILFSLCRCCRCRRCCSPWRRCIFFVEPLHRLL